MMIIMIIIEYQISNINALGAHGIIGQIPWQDSQNYRTG